MKFSKYIYTVIVLLIYIPLVFMGANVFFPKYTGAESYYQPEECVIPQQLGSIQDLKTQECYKEQEKNRIAFEKEKNNYNVRKYLFVVIFSLISLLIISFIKTEEVIKLGIFSGATISTFVSTLIYFNTKSKVGFAVLVLIFILVIYYINKNKKALFD
ncbi:hypothetical protein HY500_01045 [Candidatus Woesearchaeota archaeon]|nr:hypothetical protein [Candidatus Woesearchaeota archaeon]